MDRRSPESVNPQPGFWAHRRTRRRVCTRVVSGRFFWVVPAGLAVDWELVYRSRVVVVREVRTFDLNGRESEFAIVEDASRHRYPVEITREDNAENTQELEGSVVEESIP